MRFDDISGAQHVKRALEVAAAGHHTVSLFGEGCITALAILADSIGVEVVGSGADITIEVPIVPEWERDSPSEPHEHVMRRIEGYVDRDLPMNELAEGLLGYGIRHSSLTPAEVERVISVALTIANLAGDKSIHTAYMAEALQYVRN